MLGHSCGGACVDFQLALRRGFTGSWAVPSRVRDRDELLVWAPVGALVSSAGAYSIGDMRLTSSPDIMQPPASDARYRDIVARIHGTLVVAPTIAKVGPGPCPLSLPRSHRRFAGRWSGHGSTCTCTCHKARREYGRRRPRDTR